MLTFASWYEPGTWRGRPMRISKYPGRGLKKSDYNWGEVLCLIPVWSLVKAYRDGKLNQDEFFARYRKGLEQRWDEVSAWLASLSPKEDLTLLCHERDGRTCHRKVVADLVQEHRPDIQTDFQ